MLKKAIISGILFSLILLVGCNGEEVIDITENGENDAILSREKNFLSELHNEIIVSITKQTAIEADSIMVEGNVKELSVSVGFLKDVKVDDTLIQQIVEDSIKKVSETENVTISEKNITIKIEKY
ncbi:topoisomerase [Sporosarcina sp. Marseille-Q4943]|uniref:topoisomerase n=1 Tax=Sporosarcina sp. Marseille-Q4943 TaxID=2942204 RepID=UPI00208DA2DB|nr:topoisomerase [Sporosarcina sp. Marseille-Q4943]